MADDAFEMVLEPAFGDGVLRLADVQKVREPALSGERVLVRLRDFRWWDTGVPEFVGRWLAECDVSYLFDLSCGAAGREFARLARQAAAELFDVSVQSVADGTA